MVPGERALPNAANAQHTVADSLSIISFMSRPQLIVKDLAWADIDERGLDLFSKVSKIPLIVPDVNLTPMLKCKLDGITSFRATAVLRLQFQTQPFQCGRLIFGAIPMPTLIQPRNKHIRSHPSLLQAINHVQVDINKHTEISLRIPFVSPFNAYNLIDGKYPWAELVLMVYSPLRDPQKNTVPIRVYSHFEDIELGTPCSSEIGKVDRPSSQIITPPDTPDSCSDGFRTEDGRCIRLSKLVVQQSGRPRKDATAQQVNASRAQESGGKVASILDPVGQGARAVYDAVGNTVPFLKPVTDVFSTLSSLGGQFIHNLFGWLGFSKPQTSYAGFSVLARPTEFFCNANGVDHSHVLSLDKLNAIDEFPGLGGTSFDEMDMNYLIRIPQWIGAFTYKAVTSLAEKDEALWTSYVCPNYFLPGFLRVLCPTDFTATINEKELQEQQPTILNYASSFFMYWTGSLTYTFRFMKTSFHSGRVRITYHPFTNTVDRDRLDYVYNTIIDLRENSEVSLTIPYVAPQPWKRVQLIDPLNKDPIGFWEKYGPGVTGRIEVNAITDLICSNPQVSNEIECVIEVRAGDDFKLMAPVRSGFYPFSVENTEPVRRSNLVVQQSGTFAIAGTQETRTSAVEGFQPLSITTSSVDIHRNDTQKLCAGESFSNFRTLLKRFAFVERTSFFPNEETLQRRMTDYLNAPLLEKKPFFAYQDPSQPPIQANLAAIFGQFKYQWNVSPLCAIGQMYAFFRGGMRIKLFCDDNPKLMSCRLIDDKDALQKRGANYEEIAVSKRRALPYNAPTAYEFTSIKGFSEFQIPFYSPVILGILSKYSAESEFNKSAALIDISSSNLEDEKKAIQCSIAVAGADDLNFHGFLGVPPVISINTLNDFYQIPPGLVPWTDESQVSWVDTSNTNVDPTYPLNQFTPVDSKWSGWRPGDTPGTTPVHPFEPVKDTELRFCVTGLKGIGCD